MKECTPNTFLNFEVTLELKLLLLFLILWMRKLSHRQIIKIKIN